MTPKLTPAQSKEPQPKRHKCGYADRYKAIREPTCGCVVCEKKWRAALKAWEREQ